MELERNTRVGEQYTGRHRVFEMDRGTGLIPHGDRDRGKYEYGVETVEDRGCDPNIRRI